MLYLKENWSANDHSSLAESDSDNRVRPRFFDQVGHQTTNESIGNK